MAFAPLAGRAEIPFGGARLTNRRFMIEKSQLAGTQGLPGAQK
jgi:hypothetical protein